MAAEEPVVDTDPSLDDSLCKTMEIVAAIQQISALQEETDRKVRGETRAHTQTKQKIKAAEADHCKAREAHEAEQKTHEATKAKMQMMERSHAKAVENLKDQMEDLSAIRLHNEALALEMEAQRKAFAVNVNWAARHADLVKKNEEYTNAHETSQKELMQVSGELGGALETSKTIATKLAELERLQEADLVAAAQRKRGKSQAMAQLEKSLGAADDGLLVMCLSGWKATADSERTKKLRKESGKGQAMRAIAAQGTALVQMIFSEWLKDTESGLRERLKQQKEQLEMHNKDSGAGAERARQKALAALNKSFAKNSAGLVKISFEGWRHVRVARLKGEKGKNAAIAGIANTDRAIQDFCITAWFQIIVDNRGKKEKKDQSMTKALRMVAGSQGALLLAVVSVWGAMSKKSKNSRNKIKMVERNLASGGEALLQAIVAKWGQEARRAAQMKGKKDGNMKAGLRAIANSDQALLASIHSVWSKHAHAEQAKTKSKDRSMGQAMRMISDSNQTLVVQVFGGWSLRSKQKARNNTKLRVLSRLMSHQNMQYLIACFIGWVRTANSEAMQLKTEKEAEMKNFEEAKELLEAAEVRLEGNQRRVVEMDGDMVRLEKEVENSRKKARMLGEELGKIGVFLTSQPRTPKAPREGQARPGSGARHGSSTKKANGKDDGSPSLPKIEAASPQPGGERPASRAGGGGVKSPAPPSKMAWQEEPL